jgi:ketosteroid isomerase-like protein
VTPASPATTVVAIARQWLEAYHRQDRAAMAALSTDNLLLADERRADERFPPGLSDVTRTLDRVSVQIAADTAVLTAVMMEQSGSSPATPHVSPISQVWVLGGGQWKVRQARFVSEARLNQVFK